MIGRSFGIETRFEQSIPQYCWIIELSGVRPHLSARFPRRCRFVLLGADDV